MRIARGISIVNASKPISTAAAFDADALAYFTANTAITSTADKTAINNFYLGLKSDGIYTKIKAMYLPIWGSSANCKWNLVNPQDTNGAFRLTFSTGWTFTNGGMTPLNAFANTNLIPSTVYSVGNSGHMSYYSRTNSNGASEREMGSMTSTIYSDLGIRYSNNLYMRWGEIAVPTQVTNTDSLGFYIASRTTTTSEKIFKNGTQILTSTSSGNSRPTVNFYIGCQNSNNTATNYTLKQCAFSSLGDGLTDSEAINFNTRINTLMTYFGINV